MVAPLLKEPTTLSGLKWLRGHCAGAERERLWTEVRDGFAAKADDFWTARALGALAEDAESLTVLKALRSAVASGL